MAAIRLNTVLTRKNKLPTQLDRSHEECLYSSPWTPSTGNKLLGKLNGSRGDFGMQKTGMQKTGKRRMLTCVNAINLAIDGLIGSGNDKEHQFDNGNGGDGNDGQGGWGGGRSGGNGGGGSGDANWGWRLWEWTCNSFVGKIVNTFLYGISNCTSNQVEAVVIQAIAKVVVQPLIAEFILSMPLDVLLQLLTAGLVTAVMMGAALISMLVSTCSIIGSHLMLGIAFAAVGFLCLSLLACFVYFGWPWQETLP